MGNREDITRELLAGEAPYQLSKRYPRASVYRIYSELLQDGKIPGEAEVIHAEDIDAEDSYGNKNPFEPVISKTKTVVVEKNEIPLGKTGAEVIDFGPKGLPISAINRIRGVLGISLRPKVLSCPTPELLYPAMVISITELGFPPMRPDDFIDTVLYQWLDACDIVPYAFMKKSELREFAKKYGETEEIVKDEKFRRDHNLVTTEEIKEAVLEPLIKKESDMAKEMESESPKNLDDKDIVEEPEIFKDELSPPAVGAIERILEVVLPEPNEEELEPQPHKPTVGELLQRLHINNIMKEVNENGSTGSAKSDNP